jgi:endonuclease-3
MKLRRKLVGSTPAVQSTKRWKSSIKLESNENFELNAKNHLVAGIKNESAITTNGNGVECNWLNEEKDEKKVDLGREPKIKIEIESSIFESSQEQKLQNSLLVESLETKSEDLLQFEVLNNDSKTKLNDVSLKTKSNGNAFLDFKSRLGSFEETKNPIQLDSNVAANVFKKIDDGDELVGPENWAKMYNLIVDMRNKFVAPVDTQGCERIATTINPNIKLTNPQVYRFQILISLMLSSQTKDEINYDAMVRLQTYYLQKGFKYGLCLQGVLETSEQEVDRLICKVGFHNRKASYIKKTCKILQEKFDLDIPQNLQDIVTLPGVGPKMGFLLLQNAWNINSGIGIDVHLNRLIQMWNWIPKTKNPEQSRLELQKWLPQKYWKQINPLLVGFGQVICPPKSNNCDICLLGKYRYCKVANKKLVNSPIDESRLEKLKKQRADLSILINYIL